MKKILIIHTGGTISMQENKATGEVNRAGQHPLTEMTKNLEIDAYIEEVILFDLPSPQMTPVHMLELRDLIHKSICNYDGFIITHGTDTLEETAYFLDITLQIDQPVIITGAMRSSNEVGSDALFNLICSMQVALDSNSANQGVHVVMNGEIHAARDIIKISSTNLASFQSPNNGPIGIVLKDEVRYYRKLIAQKSLNISKLTKRVFLVKAYAGMDETLLEAIFDAAPDGIVIEAFGQGNLPAHIMPVLKRILETTPVVLVSRCIDSIVKPVYGYPGGGRELEKLGVIFTDQLTGPKARLKLLIGLETSADHEDLTQLFK